MIFQSSLDYNVNYLKLKLLSLSCELIFMTERNQINYNIVWLNSSKQNGLNHKWLSFYSFRNLGKNNTLFGAYLGNADQEICYGLCREFTWVYEQMTFNIM